MKVKELIAELQTYDPEEEVLIRVKDKPALKALHVWGMFWDGIDGRCGYMPVIGGDVLQKRLSPKLKKLLNEISGTSNDSNT